MPGIEFTNTNKQRGLQGCSLFFLGVFLIAAGYIIINAGTFIKEHPIGFFFIILMVIGFLVPFFRMRGKETKGNTKLSDASLMVGGTQRYPLGTLILDVYTRNGKNDYFHLYTRDKGFTLYTPYEDDLISELLKKDIEKNYYEVTNYDFRQGQDSIVYISAEEGRELSFNLDTGTFKIRKSGEEEFNSYTPVDFIQTPKFVYKV